MIRPSHLALTMRGTPPQPPVRPWPAIGGRAARVPRFSQRCRIAAPFAAATVSPGAALKPSPVATVLQISVQMAAAAGWP
jgi:hypothetical protein